MANLVEITLLTPHRVLGQQQIEGAQCAVHKGVADDLINRGIAQIDDENTAAGRSTGSDESAYS